MIRYEEDDEDEEEHEEEDEGFRPTTPQISSTFDAVSDTLASSRILKYTMAMSQTHHSEALSIMKHFTSETLLAGKASNSLVRVGAVHSPNLFGEVLVESAIFNDMIHFVYAYIAITLVIFVYMQCPAADALHSAGSGHDDRRLFLHLQNLRGSGLFPVFERGDPIADRSHCGRCLHLE